MSHSPRSKPRRFRRGLGIGIVFIPLIWVAWGKFGPRSRPRPAQFRGHIELASPHFTIASDGLDTTVVRALGVALDSNRQRILDDLETSSIAMTHVVIQEKGAFDAQWGALIGGSGIGFQVQGLTAPDGTIYIYGPWAADHPGKPLATVAIHEFTHAATRRSAIDHAAASGRDTVAYIVSMTELGTRVRWLSETIAVYEAGQSTDLNRFWYLIRGNYPSIGDLNDPRKNQVYDVGYRLAEFIRAKWGPRALVSLVQHDGDVQAALGISEADLMHRWFTHIQERYLLIKPRWFKRVR